MSTISAANDIVLLRRFAEKRDQSAFTEITRRYAGMVYAAAYRVLHDKQLAEDATQETFLKLLRRPDAVSVSLGGWLHKAATQLAIDVSRSESCRRAREKAHSEQMEELLDEQKSWREISATVDEAMAELPDEARDLLVQHFILGRSQKDISQEQHVSIATICRRVNDAMEQLRAVMRRRGVSVTALSVTGTFLSMHGSQAISAALQQELGKMTLVAGLRHVVRFSKPLGGQSSGGMGWNGWQVKELQLAGMVAAGALTVIVLVAVALHHAKPAESGASAESPSSQPAALQVVKPTVPDPTRK